MSYLIEPYNAWSKSPRKKHWMEIVEEENLQHRIMMEQAAAVSAQQVQDASEAAPAAGAGGVPPYEYFNNAVAVAKILKWYSYGDLLTNYPNHTVYTSWHAAYNDPLTAVASYVTFWADNDTDVINIATSNVTAIVLGNIVNVLGDSDYNVYQAVTGENFLYPAVYPLGVTNFPTIEEVRDLYEVVPIKPATFDWGTPFP